jgi:hypothetical protein
MQEIKVSRKMIDAGMEAARFKRGEDTLIYLTKYPQHQDQIFEMIYRAMHRAAIDGGGPNG